MQYTAQANRGGFFNVLFGQSYQLFGQNSFAVGDPSNTGLNSGLDTTRADYVARAAYQPNRIYSFHLPLPFDEGDFTLRRLELEAVANFDRWNISAMYGNYDAPAGTRVPDSARRRADDGLRQTLDQLGR